VSHGRQSTEIDRLSTEYVKRYAELDPDAALVLGIPGHEDRSTDYSPELYAGLADLSRRSLSRLRELRIVDEVDRVSALALAERIEAELALLDAGEIMGRLNVVESPVQRVREAFDMLPTETVDQREAVARRLRTVPAALAGFRESLGIAVDSGLAPARRQVLACTEHSEEAAAEGGQLLRIAREVAGRPDTPASLAEELVAAATLAARAYAGLAEHLRTDVLPLATETDSFGRERHRLHLRYHLGDDADVDDAYEWGVQEVRRLRAEGDALAEALSVTGGIDAAVEALDRDPARRIEGTAAFRDWMQAVSDEAVRSLADRQFDIPPPARRLDCRIAPTTTGVIYYSSPSEDFSRPGAMWWSVPQATTSFATWQQRTVVYHEGVPGHHLQRSASLVQGDRLNQFRRTWCWTSGYAEGWALYAEGLMAELGFLAEPGDRLGLVATQLLRAVRVVLDIGIHCGLPAPEEAGGAAWTFEAAWEYLRTMVPQPEAQLRFELDRYVGWPGQASTYALGQRALLAHREAARDAATREGRDFDPVTWHRSILDLGALGLGPLRQALGG
jgi:uncharacterized protein (DUF885 family)